MPDWISHFRKWLEFLGILWKAWLRGLPVTDIRYLLVCFKWIYGICLGVSGGYMVFACVFQVNIWYLLVCFRWIYGIYLCVSGEYTVFACVFQVDIWYSNNRTSMNLKWPSISADYDKGHGTSVRCIIRNFMETSLVRLHVARKFTWFSVLVWERSVFNS